MHRHHPVLAHPVLQARPAIATLTLHVLEQQLPQQLRRRHYLLPLIAALRQRPLSLPGQLQQPVVSATIAASNVSRALRSDQSMPASPLMLEPV